MKLVVDTNIIFKALIKRSKVRGILLNPNHQFYLPEYASEEVEKHLSLIRDKSGLSEKEVKHALSILLANMQVVPSKDILKKWDEAERIIGKIDTGDIPFIALALAIECDGIWSDDKDLKRQAKVKVWSTREIIQGI
ncbi:MAG: PIN domain-containing protein [Thaumarchaeota archaeon]|nr:PIN domain-containing protein [Nitrososphaerota archaeon]